MSELLELYDRQLRRNTNEDASGSRLEATATYVRSYASDDGIGWSEVLWTSLEGTDVEEAITEQVEFYSARGLSFHWTVYDYDRPIDLGERLVRRGFAPPHHTSVVIAPSDSLGDDVSLPPGLELVEIHDEAGVDQLIAVHESVFGHQLGELRGNLVRRLAVAPEEMSMFVVLNAEGAPVSSSRVEYFFGTDFAALWGGSTEERWRHHGLYRAQVVRRAREAHRRGFRYVMVMASEYSRPILEELGFTLVARAARYTWPSSGPRSHA